MRKVIFTLIILTLTIPVISFAHRSGCHRWHSCPSDSGSYSCGDAGHPCLYPTYPASGGVIYPPSGYYKDCYDCPLKKVPSNSFTSGISFTCNNGYKKVNNTCVATSTNTNNKVCTKEYGSNSYWDGTKTADGLLNCSCLTGYNWDSLQTSCVVNFNLLPNGCISKIGFSPTTGISCSSDMSIFSNNQACTKSFFNTSWNGTLSTNGGPVCDCKDGYKWNFDRTACIYDSSNWCQSNNPGLNVETTTYSNGNFSCICYLGSNKITRAQTGCFKQHDN